MSKIIIMQGLPASGKTTEAKELMKRYGNFVRVNKDDLREMMLSGNWNYAKEKNIVKAQTGIIETMLKAGTNIIVDDTNFSSRHINRINEIAKLHKAKVETRYITTDVFECVARDKAREKKVGDHVIFEMALNYKLWKPDKGIIICDIDGTLADIKHRLHFARGEKKNWKSFFEAIPEDKPRLDIWQEVLKEKRDLGCDLILVSGRNAKYRQETIDWFKNKIPSFKNEVLTIFMRGEHDHRVDTEVKKDFLEKIGKENIIKVYDDRPSVIRMWQENDVEVVDVGEGIEF